MADVGVDRIQPVTAADDLVRGGERPSPDACLELDRTGECGFGAGEHSTARRSADLAMDREGEERSQKKKGFHTRNYGAALAIVHRSGHRLELPATAYNPAASATSTENPKWTATSVASIELSTEAVPLMPQAQGIAASSTVASLRRPRGKGMPIANASGATRATLIAILAGSGRPSARPVRTRTITSAMSAIAATANGTRPARRESMRADAPLPRPPNTRNDDRTTAIA